MRRAYQKWLGCFLIIVGFTLLAACGNMRGPKIKVDVPSASTGDQSASTTSDLDDLNSNDDQDSQSSDVLRHDTQRDSGLNLTCEPGFYCPQGSSLPYGDGECDEGFYCPRGSESPTGDGPCIEGYFCPRGSSTPKGDGVCKEGHFCPEGSGSETGAGQCDGGRYCPEKSTDAQGAGACEAGNYCPPVSSTPTGEGPCDAGYFCPEGSASATEAPSGLGFFAPAGSSEPLDCGKGFYCPNEANPEPIACTNAPQNSEYTNMNEFNPQCAWQCLPGFAQDGQGCFNPNNPNPKFYAGTAGQSCNEVCTGKGGVNAATLNVIGTNNSGAVTECQNVAASLGFNATSIVINSNYDLGCGVANNQLYYFTQPTKFETKNAAVRRICACNG